MLLSLNNFKTLLFVISINYSVIPVNPLYQNLCLSIRLTTLLLLKIEVKSLIRDQKSAIKEERENIIKLFIEESSHIPWPYSTTKIFFESFILLIHRKIAVYFSSNTLQSWVLVSSKPIRLNCRIPGHFGPPHLHVSGGFEDRGITQ